MAVARLFPGLVWSALLVTCGSFNLQASAAPQEQLTTIELERIPQVNTFNGAAIGFGEDRLVLHSDGRAEYNSCFRALTPSGGLGLYRGTFDRADFRRLARMVESNAPTKPRTQDRPNPSWSAEYTVIYIQHGDRRTTVASFKKPGPVKLRQLEASIRGVVSKVEWVKAEK